jgi:hypothetical protein
MYLNLLHRSKPLMSCRLQLQRVNVLRSFTEQRGCWKDRCNHTFVILQKHITITEPDRTRILFLKCPARFKSREWILFVEKPYAR